MDNSKNKNTNDELENNNTDNQLENIDNKDIANNTTENSLNHVKKNQTKGGWISEIFSWLVVIVSAIVVSSIINYFMFSIVKVDGGSMENTLISGEKLILNRAVMFVSEPKVGDIVVVQMQKGSFSWIPAISMGEVNYIKRLIGVEGDMIDIHGGKVYRNGVELQEDYIKEKGKTKRGGSSITYPLEIPEGMVFVMGDNRNHSYDGREFGLLEKDKLLGTTSVRLVPFSKFGFIEEEVD